MDDANFLTPDGKRRRATSRSRANGRGAGASVSASPRLSELFGEQVSISDDVVLPSPPPPPTSPPPLPPEAFLKSVDVCAFNAGAEIAFVARSRELIRAAGGAIACSVVAQELAFDLDVSVETVKRYIVKHSASRGEFCSERGFLRER